MESSRDRSRIGWHFDTTYLSLPPCFFRSCRPSPARQPQLLLLNEPLADELGLAIESLRREDAGLWTGNCWPAGATPIAQAYAGHQFGQFTQLGDGRALVWGEHVTPDGRRVDVQWKGSGPTPFARRGDGRAAVGPMIREYLISEAMHALQVPTTRSLAVAATGETVWRETPLPGAVLTRVAASHIRVGTFQYAALQGRDAVAALLNYSLRRHYPQCLDQKRPAAAFLDAVVRRQAHLIAQWMSIGFIHGVMNTDNMAISGETIDYGPCAFMDRYDPATVFSSIDSRGRYAFANQPGIAQWNLARLAETLLPLLDEEQDAAIICAEAILKNFEDEYLACWRAGMNAKLGLQTVREGDQQLVQDLLQWMHDRAADYTGTFAALSGLSGTSASDAFDDPEFRAWSIRWRDRAATEIRPPEEQRRLMQRCNPVFVPRNHLVETALQAAQDGDLQPTRELLAILGTPYAYDRALPEYANPGPFDPQYRTFCGT